MQLILMAMPRGDPDRDSDGNNDHNYNNCSAGTAHSNNTQHQHRGDSSAQDFTLIDHASSNDNDTRSGFIINNNNIHNHSSNRNSGSSSRSDSRGRSSELPSQTTAPGHASTTCLVTPVGVSVVDADNLVLRSNPVLFHDGGRPSIYDQRSRPLLHPLYTTLGSSGGESSTQQTHGNETALTTATETYDAVFTRGGVLTLDPQGVAGGSDSLVVSCGVDTSGVNEIITQSASSRPAEAICSIVDENMNFFSRHPIDPTQVEISAPCHIDNDWRSTPAETVAVGQSFRQREAFLEGGSGHEVTMLSHHGHIRQQHSVLSHHITPSYPERTLLLPLDCESLIASRRALLSGEVNVVPLETNRLPIWTPLARRDNAPVVPTCLALLQPNASVSQSSTTATVASDPSVMFTPIREEQPDVKTSSTEESPSSEKFTDFVHHPRHHACDAALPRRKDSLVECHASMLEEYLSDGPDDGVELLYSQGARPLLDSPHFYNGLSSAYDDAGAHASSAAANSAEFSLPPQWRADSVQAQASVDEEVAMVTYGHVEEEEEMMTVEFDHDDVGLDADVSSRPANPVANILDSGGREHFVPVLTDVFHTASRNN
ncbi:uncharacterized protein LOC101863755 [Aplysia californica]|uniref:Uncharacterized protein LOC101863755 n=1 Tax=Aplysia californica TaxID=6500 RepID=A0ABM1A3R6_APLCA|nr:uncharacterized protein LOC101863755 [Aplysia californica]